LFDDKKLSICTKNFRLHCLILGLRLVMVSLKHIFKGIEWGFDNARDYVPSTPILFWAWL